jgi:hypothetical protein
VSSVSSVGNAPVAVKAPSVKAAQTPAQAVLQSALSTKPAPDGDTPAKARAERLNGGIAPKSGVNKIA